MIRFLKSKGFSVVRIKGSHHVFKKILRYNCGCSCLRQRRTGDGTY
ncbi:MAG: type II toxin-antitoxin system HicA family toxin [Thermotogaceae bacterium]|nr:type II toxin-antitoxin system HicA family toxin [Thermotogaceae bacterium]